MPLGRSVDRHVRVHVQDQRIVIDQHRMEFERVERQRVAGLDNVLPLNALEPRLLLELKNRCGENLPPDFPREPSTEE